MTIRIRMILMKEFDNLINTLEYAKEELIPLTEQVKDISTSITIAQNRVIKFKEKCIKEFEKAHKEKLKRLKEIRKSTN